MRLDGDALDALDALENLLNAESADVVNDVLDDACKAWCDGAREGEEKRTQRLRKNCEKIKEKLEVESDDEALRTTRACETVVRMSVWALAMPRSLVRAAAVRAAADGASSSLMDCERPR